MVLVKWGSRMVEVDCSVGEYVEAVSLFGENEVLFGVWLGNVGELGQSGAVEMCRWYDEILREG